MADPSERDRLLRAFDDDVRRGSPSPRAGVRVEREPHIRRTLGIGDGGWFSVDWTALDDANADQVIAGEIALFDSLGEPFEWKYYDYDRPADLERRLLAAGFVADDDESVMVARIEMLPVFEPPQGVRIERVDNENGIDRMIEIHRQVFGSDPARYRATLVEQMANDPDGTMLFIVVAGDGTAVCAARMDLPAAGRFASLWGGGTLPDWRGRGIYRALVSHRAALAAARGFEFLYVDASPDSRPILERLGFVRVARTTPYRWEPGARAAAGPSSPGGR